MEHVLIVLVTAGQFCKFSFCDRRAILTLAQLNMEVLRISDLAY